jgi:murein L,D-transpeptidase YafK
MTDVKVEEIYLLCEAALEAGQPFFRVHVFPFRMTEERMEKAEGGRWEGFWERIRPGYRFFEDKGFPPAVDDGAMRDGRYVFGER